MDCGGTKKKLVQFALIFQLHSQGRPMTRYEQMQYLFVFLKVPNYPSKCWNDCVRWEIAELIHKVALNAIKEVFLTFSFLVVSVDEITIVDSQSWIQSIVTWW
jgi:hypothetical protein